MTSIATTEIKSPKIVISTWCPMGINNMISINRYLGSHKKFKGIVTEFGMEGQIIDMADGSFTLESDGVVVAPIDYSKSNFVCALLINACNKPLGLKIDKYGILNLGIMIKNQILTLDQTKIILGKLTNSFIVSVFPIFTDYQQQLISALYEVDHIIHTPHALPSYGLVITADIGLEIENTEKFLKKYEHLLDALTDWSVDSITIEEDNGPVHIFVGVSATLCIGEPSPLLREALAHMIGLKSLQGASNKIFNLLWSVNKEMKIINKLIDKADFRRLKLYNSEISKFDAKLSILETLNGMISKTIESKEDIWNNKKEENNLEDNIFEISKDLLDEVEKADDRKQLLKQLFVDLSATRQQIEQRMELILTQNSEFLNLVVLALTIISVISIAEILNFSTNQWLVVILAMIPFIFISIIYLKKYLSQFKE